MNKGYEKRKRDYSNKKYFEKQSQIFSQLVPLCLQEKCLLIGAKTSSSYKLLQIFSDLFPTFIQMRYENEEVEEIKFTRNWKYVLSHCRCINPKSFMDTIRRNVEIFNLFPQHCKEHYCYTMSKIRKRTKKISTKYPSVKIRRTVSSRNENKVYQLNKLKSPKVDHLPIKSQQNLKENYLSKIHLNQSNSHKILDYKYPEIFNPEKRFIHNFVFFFQNLKNQNYH